MNKNALPLRLGSAALAALAGLTPLAPLAAIDFTPRTEEINFPDGSSIERRYFVDGNKFYLINLAPNSELTGDSGVARFQFRDLRGATAQMRASPDYYSFAEDHLDALLRLAESFAPPGTTPDGEWESTSNFLHLPHLPNHGLSRSYKLPGGTVRQSVVFINFTEKQQILLILTAFAEEFPKALERTTGIVGSLREITKAELQASPIN